MSGGSLSPDGSADDDSLDRRVSWLSYREPAKRSSDAMNSFGRARDSPFKLSTRPNLAVNNFVASPFEIVPMNKGHDPLEVQIELEKPTEQAFTFTPK